MSEDDTTGDHGPDAAATRAAEIAGSPRQIGPYSILRTLGRGGMSVVYLAHDPRHDRDVALKVIPAGPEADPTDLARFRAEAEAVEKLDHPNIVHLYEHGTTDEVAYLAMEFVEGGTLYRQIKSGRPFDPIDAARIVEQIARGIHYAHQHGVIHRDLKPSNILMQKVGESSIPKIADFGLAKQLGVSLRLTQTGTAIGTPHYMAPEQARGERAVGPALDIHGLGTILYELLTGLPPFAGTNPAELMEQVVHTKPTPPSRLRQGIPPALDAICMKCLEKEPRHRYRSAEELANDLRHFIDDPTDPTRMQSIRGESPSRKKLLIAIGSGLAILLIAIAATAYYTWHATRPRVQALEKEVADAKRAEQRAKLEAAIALCEQGQIALGLEAMHALDGETDLPIGDFIAAWQGRVPKQVATIAELNATVAAMSPHSEFLATAEKDHVRIWKTADWSPHGEGWPLKDEVTALGWSEDDEHIAIGTKAGSVFVGNAKTGEFKETPIVEGKEQAIAAVSFTFTGVRVVYAGDSIRQEYLPPLVEKKNVGSFQLSGGPFAGVAIAPMAGDAAALAKIGSVRLYDHVDARWPDLPPDGDATAIAYSSDGNVLAIGNSAGTVRLWDAVARLPLTDAFQVGARVNAIAVGDRATTYTIVACAEGKSAVVLRCDRPWVGPSIHLKDRPGKEILGVALSGDGSNVFVTSPYGVSLWRVRDANRYGPVRDYSAVDSSSWLPGTPARFSSPAAMTDDSKFVVGGNGGKMFVLNADGNMSPHANADVRTGDVTAVGVGKNGQVCSASMGKPDRSVVHHWGRSMDDKPEFMELNTRVNQEAFLPDGSAVALACADGRVRIWEPATNQFRKEFDCHSPVLSVAVSNDGRRIAAGCADGTANVIDLSTGGIWPTLRHRSEVRAVSFHGLDLITASADGMCRRWHLAMGLPLGPPMFHPDAINALSVVNDLVATGGRGRYVRVWRIE